MGETEGADGVWTTSCLNYFPILYVRSPAAFLEDSTFPLPCCRGCDEAADRVRLTTRGLHDLGKGGSFGALPSGDGLLMFSLSIAFSLTLSFSLTGLRSSQSSPGREKLQAQSAGD
jgi:hypothetical protein